MKTTTKIAADVDPKVKEKLVSLKQDGETLTAALIRIINKEYDRYDRKITK